MSNLPGEGTFMPVREHQYRVLCLAPCQKFQAVGWEYTTEIVKHGRLIVAFSIVPMNEDETPTYYVWHANPRYK